VAKHAFSAPRQYRVGLATTVFRASTRGTREVAGIGVGEYVLVLYGRHALGVAVAPLFGEALPGLGAEAPTVCGSPVVRHGLHAERAANTERKPDWPYRDQADHDSSLCRPSPVSCSKASRRRAMSAPLPSSRAPEWPSIMAGLVPMIRASSKTDTPAASDRDANVERVS
jgi:hypothetical protein